MPPTVTLAQPTPLMQRGALRMASSMDIAFTHCLQNTLGITSARGQLALESTLV